MPIVGIDSLAVISAASERGTPSITTAKAPACSTATASSSRRSRPPASLPACAALDAVAAHAVVALRASARCGRRPGCRRGRWRRSCRPSRRRPPASRTRRRPSSAAPRSRRACCGLTWYEPNGRSPTTSAAVPARATSAHVVRHLVERHRDRRVARPGRPSPRESPTRIMSTPAGVDERGERRVVGRDHGDPSPAGLHRRDGRHRDRASGGGGWVVIGLLKAGLRSLDCGPAPGTLTPRPCRSSHGRRASVTGGPGPARVGGRAARRTSDRPNRGGARRRTPAAGHS